MRAAVVSLLLLAVSCRASVPSNRVANMDELFLPSDTLDWGQTLNSILTNQPATARRLSEHASMGNCEPDGICKTERICIQKGLNELDFTTVKLFTELDANNQLLLVLVASLNDMSLYSLAPLYEAFHDEKDVRRLLEQTMYLMGYGEMYGVQKSYGSNEEERVKMDKSGWTKAMKNPKERGLCDRCFINVAPAAV